MSEKQARILAIIKEIGPTHGAPIANEYEQRHGSISIGFLYVILDALEEKGLIECKEEAGGRAKRVCKITEKGRRELDAA